MRDGMEGCLSTWSPLAARDPAHTPSSSQQLGQSFPAVVPLVLFSPPLSSTFKTAIDHNAFSPVPPPLPSSLDPAFDSVSAALLWVLTIRRRMAEKRRSAAFLTAHFGSAKPESEEIRAGATWGKSSSRRMEEEKSVRITFRECTRVVQEVVRAGSDRS